MRVQFLLYMQHRLKELKTQTKMIKKLKHPILPIMLLVMALVLFINISIKAQSTNPAIQSLTYTFNSYTGSGFPASMSIGQASSNNLVTTDFTTNAPHGGSSGQWNDEGNNGVSYQGSSSFESGCFKVRMNTTGLTNISVSWTGRRIASGSAGASSYMELQWRNGNSGSWINEANDQYDSDNSTTSFSILLPAACNNLADLQIRWIVYDQSFLFGSRDRVAVDDIKICAAPSVSASNGGPVCSGTTLNLTSSPSGMSYQWTGPNGFSSTQQNPSISNAPSAANGTYTVTITNASGCSASTTTNATVNTTPVATAGSNSPACTGNNLNLTSGPNGYSYQWSGPGGFTSTSQNPTRSNTQASYAGVYTVTVTNAGCASTTSIAVTVNNSPVATAGNNGPVCSGTTLNLTSSGGGTYQWSGPSGFSSTLQNPSRTNTTTSHSGTYTVTVTLSGCTATATTGATVNQTPAATIGSNSPVCETNTLNLTSGPNGYSYQWSGPGGYSSTSQNPTRSSAQQSYGGTYIVTVTNAGCSSTASTVINIGTPISASASNNGPLCHGATMNLSASTIAGGSYQWSGPNGFASTSQNPSGTAFSAQSGIYNLTISAGGCTANATTTVTVNPVPAMPSAISTPSTICEGLPVNLNSNADNILYGNTNDFAIPDNNSTGISSPLQVSGFSPSTITATMVKSVNFNINHTYDGDLEIWLVAPNASQIRIVNNRGGSGNNFTNTTIVNSGGANGNVSSGSAPFTGTYNTDAAFSGLSGTVNGTWNLKVIDQANADIGTILDWKITFVTNSGVSYSWTSNPAGFTSNLQSPTATPSGTTVYIASAIYNGCSASNSTTVNVTPAPVPVAYSNAPVCEGVNVNFSANNVGSGQSSGNSYSWTGPSGFASNQQNPSITNPTSANNGNYTLTVTNQFLCTATTTTSVMVNSIPVLSLSTQTNVTCNGFNDGTVTVIATGGSAPYLFTDNSSFLVDNSMATFTNYGPGTYNFYVTDANNCDNMMQAPAIGAAITEPDVLAFSNSAMDELCPGFNNGSITINASGGTLPYQYSFNNGSTYQSQNTINNLAPGLYNVIVNDAHNCYTLPQQVTLTTTYTSSVPPSSITTNDNNNEICLGTGIQLTQVGGSLSNAPGTDYVWREGSSTGNIVGTGSSINVTPSVSTVYFVGTEGMCGNQSNAMTAVQVTTALPSAAVIVPPINGLPAYACNGSTATLSVPLVSGATQYIWDGPSGTSFNSGGNPFTANGPVANITFGNPSGSGYYIGVQASNACGVTLRKVQWVRSLTSVPSTIMPTSGLITNCPSTAATFTCPAVVGATAYLWSITGDATINGTGTTATVNFGPNWNGGQICVSSQTSCYTSPTKCLNLGLNVSPVTLPQIQGVFTVCQGSTQTYTVAGLTGVANFSWTLPPGASGSSTSNAINVAFGSGFLSGDICVAATSICGVTSIPRCKTIVKGTPTVPASLTGPQNGICGQSVTYSCPSQAGSSYNWTLPGGATGSSTTNSIGVTFPSTSFTVGAVCVQASNSCGSSGNRCITVKGAPNTPSSITALPGSFCANTAGVEFIGDVSNLSGSYSLNWTWYPANAANYVIGQSTNNLIVDWNASNASVQLAASNACGSGTKTYNVTLNCRTANQHGQEILTDAINTENEMLSFYPNPVTDLLNIEITASKNEMISIEIMDVAGRAVVSKEFKAEYGFNKAVINLETMNKGAYILHIQMNDKTLKKQVIVQ